MTAATQIELISVEDYLAREAASTVKHEYVGGYVYAMADKPNVHNTIAGAFLGILYAKLREKPS